MCIGEKFPIWNAMIVLILISFPSRAYTQTGIHILHTPSTITAVLGQDMTIPCLVARNDNQELNLSAVNVGWTKRSSSGNIHDVYQYLGHRDKKFRPGSLIEENELKRGNASLTLHHAQTSDEGKYTCRVFITPYKATAEVDVHLLAQPNVTLSSAKLIVELGREKSLTCEVTRFYPEAVKIRWVKYRKGSGTRSSLDKATCLSVPEENSDGTFNASSLLTVKPSSLEEDGDLYSCVVTHLSFNQDQAINFILTVKEPPTSFLIISFTSLVVVTFIIVIIVLFLYFIKLPPKISDIVGIQDLVHGKSSSLSWMVSGFIPRNIEIRVYLERSDQQQELGFWKYPPPQAQNYDADREKGNKPHSPNLSGISYNCLCSTSITPDKRKDKGAELVIEVKHAALKTSLIKRQKLNIKGDYFTAHIVRPQCVKHGEEVTLTCDITKCDPGPLLITWLKEKQVIYKDGRIQDTRYTYTETRDVPHEGNMLKSSSSLTFTAKVKEDHGVKYTCIVSYSKIEKNFKPCYETIVTAQPVVEQITSEHEGRQMKLSCRVHSFHPQTIEIKWFKQYEELPTTDCELDMDEDGLYSTTSILMYIPKIEDIGKTFKCQVDHQSLPIPEVREWKLEEQRMISTTS